MCTAMIKVLRATVLVAIVFASVRPIGAQVAQQPDTVFSVNASTSAGYDTDITSRNRNPNADTDAAHLGGQLSLNFSKRTERQFFYVAGSSEYRRYLADQPIGATMHSVNSGVSTPLSRRIDFTGSVAASYSPRLVLSVLPLTSDAPIEQLPVLDYGVTARDIVAYQAHGGLRFALSQRSDFSIGYTNGRF